MQKKTKKPVVPTTHVSSHQHVVSSPLHPLINKHKLTLKYELYVTVNVVLQQNIY